MVDNTQLISIILCTKLSENVSSSSESDDTDDSDDDMVLFKAATALLERRNIPKISTFTEVIMAYDDHEFRRHFRLTRGTFHRILEHLNDKIHIRIYKGGRPQMSLEKQLLITLWYFANTECYRSIGSRFDVCEATVMKAIDSVVSAVITDKSRFIRWPKRERINSIEEGFRALQGMPGVVGAIDGTHIPIPSPANHHENYVNRKGFHSIIAQVVCDSDMKFTSVNVGWPGSVHDARIFRNSKIGKKIINGTLLGDEHHLIGDAAYPLSKHLLTPYKDFGNLTRQQQRYNYIQSSTRIVVERSIGQLKGRFRKLKMLDCSLQKASDFTTFCCALHNICLSEGDILDEDEIDECENINNCAGPQVRDVNGLQKRNQLAERL